MADGDQQIVLDEAKDGMDKSLRSLRAEYQKVRTGRANPQLLDGLQVDYYGAPTPINQLANLTAPDARLIVVAPFDQTAIGDIEKAIQAAGLGLTPSNDGKVVRVPVPPLTEERRRDIVKQLKKTAEEHKIGVREARRDALAMLKELENDSSLGSDDRRRCEKSVQDLTDEHVKKIDEMTSAKEEEILQV